MAFNSSTMKKVTIAATLILVAFAVLAAAEPRRGRGRGRGRVAPVEATEEENSGRRSKKPAREGKFFSVFNIVQFENAGCQSTSSLTGSTGSTARNGTCFTSTECSDKGGTASGSCAAGFGVCCIFLVSTSGSTVSQNCTYIRNPNFPSAETASTGIQYTINKCANNICKLRLDFETFSIQGTGNTLEADAAAGNAGGVCMDTFDITVNTNQRIPQICGENAGQHMYIDIGRQASDSATLNFAFTGTTTNRLWEIKVSQIPCYGACSKSYNPPEGCLQWHTGLTGRFRTFNFDTTTDNHLANQDYSVCIRQEAGFCCVLYTPCADANSFSLALDGAGAVAAGTDSLCSLDYIAIPESSSACNQNGSPLPVTGKYCGVFNDAVAITMAVPICDCTQPFIVDVFTDALDDVGVIAGNAVRMSRGVCLEWQQIAC